MATSSLAITTPIARRTSSPAWSGFVATLVSEVKATFREPSALVFTLLQPVILLAVLDAFNFHFTLPNGEVRPYIDRLLPGMIAFNGLGVGINSIAFGLMRYKQRGTLRRVRSTPVPTGSFLCGIVASRLVTTALVTVITYVTGVYVFGGTLDGNLGLIFSLAMLGSLAFISLGLLMVAVAKTEDDIAPMFMLILMPSMLFSGAFLDRSGLPDWLHWITGGLPLTFLTHAIQEVANLDAGFAAVRGDILGLAVWGIAGTILCAWRFKMA
jgi:ABC-2 type transport system permease protein